MKKQVLFSLFSTVIIFIALNLLALPFCSKRSVFWENELMIMYPVDVFDQNATVVQHLENNDPDRLVRYVQDDNRWYRLDPEPEIPEDVDKVINFGDSSTWGWGLIDKSDTYASKLQKFLPDNVCSVNLGVPGYSSLQGLKYVEEVIQAHHQHIVAITLYFGNNDSIENGLSDAQKQQRITSWKAKLSCQMNRLPLFRAMLKGINYLRPLNNKQPRVDPEEYEKNMRKIIAIARSHDIQVIIIEPVVHLSWIPGHVTHTLSLKPHVRNSWVRGELDLASQLYEQGMAMVARGSDRASYESTLTEALSHDWVVPRFKPAWKAKFDSFVGLDGVSVVSFPNFHLETEMFNFVDWCHPSPKLHEKIAWRIAINL